MSNIYGVGHVHPKSVGAPVCPLLTSPSNGASFDAPASVALTWNAANDAVSYNVYVWLSTDSEPTTPTANVAGLSYDASVSAGVSYRWKVASVNSAGEAQGCSTYTFHTFLGLESAALCDDNPASLGVAAPGVSNNVSRCDHVHEMPAASDIEVDNTEFSTLSGVDVQSLMSEIDVQLGTLAVNQPVGTFLINGGGVTWLQDYDYAVSAATYVINGVQQSSLAQEVTLDPADITNGRIDAIVVNNVGVVEVLTGVPAANPEAPDVDPETQLQLTFVFVAAGSTSPNVTVVDIYQNNAEWTYSDNTVRFDPDSTADPYSGAKAIEATAVVSNDRFTLENGADVDIGAYDNLTFWIKSKDTWVNKQLRLFWMKDGVQQGNYVALTGANNGFDSTNTATYQPVVIPTSYFGINGVPVNQLRFRINGAGASIGFFVDNIQLQAGVAPPESATDFMLFRSTWTSTASYARQEVVLHNDISYVAINANNNSEPQPDGSNADWVALSSEPLTQGTGLDADAAGFRGIPQNSQSGNYTTVAADAGKHIFHDSGAGAGDTFTIDSNANVPYEIGTAITFINMDSNALGIAIASDTMYLAGTGTTGSRNLAQYGVATAVKITATSWIISGTGLT